ncbi:MAG: hypothetical protein JWO46_1093, partial [Nocardioidaceae bacterium]|nr:hypothetical protein [Nocardioidaceae bacterium]
ALKDKIAVLRDVPGVRIVGSSLESRQVARGPSSGQDQRVGTLRYRFTDAQGRVRRVSTALVGYDVQQGAPRAYFEVTVAGPRGSGPALDALLDLVSPTVFSTP